LSEFQLLEASALDKKGNTNYQTGKILKLKKGNKKIMVITIRA